MELLLTSDERELLTEILEERQRELLREIAKAHHRDFRVALQKKEALLQTMLEKMRVGQTVEFTGASL